MSSVQFTPVAARGVIAVRVRVGRYQGVRGAQLFRERDPERHVRHDDGARAGVRAVDRSRAPVIGVVVVADRQSERGRAGRRSCRRADRDAEGPRRGRPDAHASGRGKRDPSRPTAQRRRFEVASTAVTGVLRCDREGSRTSADDRVGTLAGAVDRHRADRGRHVSDRGHDHEDADQRTSRTLERVRTPPFGRHGRITS